MITPDAVLAELEKVYGIKVTRRTLLSYEKQGLIPAPYFETGKYKEYPRSVVGEFVASWMLIHGEYGLKPQRVADVRDNGLRIVYRFGELVEDLVGRTGASQSDEVSLLSGPKIEYGVKYEVACPLLEYRWLIVKFLCDSKTESDDVWFSSFVEDGDFSCFEAINVRSTYKLYDDEPEHKWVFEKLEVLRGKDAKLPWKIVIIEPTRGFIVEYLHPESFILKYPQIQI